jgi:hypothetical protein
MIESIPQHLRQNILKALRALVIAFDNITPEEKGRLTTASEIVKNKDWLIKVRQDLAVLFPCSVLFASANNPWPLRSADRKDVHAGGAGVAAAGSQSARCTS